MLFKILPGVAIEIDDEGLNRVRQISWRLEKTTKRGFYFTHQFRIDGKYKTISLQRFIVNASGTDIVTFHDPSKPNDYRKSNLKICSRRDAVLSRRTLTLLA